MRYFDKINTMFHDGLSPTCLRDESEMSPFVEQLLTIKPNLNNYGKKTMKAYLWKVCGQEYDAQG